MKVHWDDVEDLAIAYRAKAALHRLMHAGVLASEAVRQGLGHPNPDVRVGCCQVLDHFLDEEAVPALIENLTHEDGRVRQWAMHALACDRCKEGACRPGEDDSVPIAIRMLKSDPDALVRDQAIRLLFPLIHSRLDIREAIESAKDDSQSSCPQDGKSPRAGRRDVLALVTASGGPQAFEDEQRPGAFEPLELTPLRYHLLEAASDVSGKLT